MITKNSSPMKNRYFSNYISPVFETDDDDTGLNVVFIIFSHFFCSFLLLFFLTNRISYFFQRFSETSLRIAFDKLLNRNRIKSNILMYIRTFSRDINTSCIVVLVE